MNDNSSADEDFDEDHDNIEVGDIHRHGWIPRISNISTDSDANKHTYT